MLEVANKNLSKWRSFTKDEHRQSGFELVDDRRQQVVPQLVRVCEKFATKLAAGFEIQDELLESFTYLVFVPWAAGLPHISQRLDCFRRQGKRRQWVSSENEWAADHEVFCSPPQPWPNGPATDLVLELLIHRLFLLFLLDLLHFLDEV